MAGPYAPTNLNNYIGIGRQAVRGTAVAPTQFAAYIAAVDLDHAQVINRIMEAGAFGEVTYAEKVSHMPVGGFELLARPSIAGRFSAYLLGADVVTGPVSTVYTHTETIDMVTDYLTVEQNLADEGIERFKDAVIAEIVYSANRDNPVLRMKASWLGGAPSFEAAPTAESYETEEPWLFSESTYTVDGGAAANVIGFELTARLRYSVERITAVTPTYLVKVGAEAEISLEQILDDVDEDYREVQYGSNVGTAAQTLARTGAFVASFDRGATTTLRQLQLSVPNLIWESAVYTPLDPGGSEATKLSRQGFSRKVAGSQTLQVVAKTLDSASYVL